MVFEIEVAGGIIGNTILQVLMINLPLKSIKLIDKISYEPQFTLFIIEVY